MNAKPPAEPGACPYLAPLPSPDMRRSAPDGRARCRASDQERPVAPQHEVVFCLASRHTECSRYRPLVTVPLPSRQRSGHGILSGIAVLAAIAAGTVISIAIVGNPLAEEPDVQGTPAATAGAAAMVYTVQPGDTLAALAARFHVSIAALEAVNNLSSVDQLPIGQVLRIPSVQTATPTPR
jgi:LysM repeat protein